MLFNPEKDQKGWMIKKSLRKNGIKIKESGKELIGFISKRKKSSTNA